MPNGLSWRVQTSGEKISYVLGLNDGIKTAYSRAIGTPCEEPALGTAKNYVPEEDGLSIGQRVNALDAFYRDSANRFVAVVQAMEIISARARSVPESVVNARLLEYRRLGEREGARKR